jgi:hypothetical protein
MAPIGAHAGKIGPRQEAALGTRMRVRVVVYAWRLAVNLAVKYSPR